MSTQRLSTDEKILVVKRTQLFAEDVAPQGFYQEKIDQYIGAVRDNQEFIWRSDAETDELYKQIIPYLIFKNNNKFFLMQRRSTASEQRLKDKYSLGIGGHIRQEDITSGSLFDWACREFYEEINYSGNLTITTLGIVNEDETAVGRVHVGFVLLLEGDSSDISVKSELKSGSLMTCHEIETYYDRLETWSKYVFDNLIISK